MHKKSFLISIGVHIALAIFVILLILIIYKPKKTIYIPLQINNFHTCNKNIINNHVETKSIKRVIKHKQTLKHKKTVKYKKIIKNKVIKKYKKIKKIKKNIAVHKQAISKPATGTPKQIHEKQNNIIYKHQLSTKKSTTPLHVNKLPLNYSTIKMIQNRYLNYIYKTIQQYKTYPYMARRLEQTGNVKLKFIILENGDISNIIIKKSSGFIALDKAAKNILIKINHFKPIPTLLAKHTLKIIIPISYQLN